MAKNEKERVEFRFYEKPSQEPGLALMGEGWNRIYGEENGRLHFHNMAEIGYCYHGKGNVVFNNEWHDYESGAFTFIPHNYPHTTNSVGSSQWEFFFFDAEELVLAAFKDNLYKGEKIRTSINKNAYIFSNAKEPFLGSMVMMIFELIRKGGNYGKDAIRCSLVNLILQIVRIESGDTNTTGPESRSKIVSSLEYINDHYRENIKICDLSESCHLSETHFRRLFQCDMNMTPIEYINLIRVQAACDLMKKEDGDMGEVAAKVGYETMSTFNRNFKQIVGISPYQWKKQIYSELGEPERYQVRAQKGWE